MLYAIIALVIVLLDQALKVWTRATLPLHTSIPFIPGIMDLSYVQNTGAAFSILSEHTWLLSLVSAVASVGIGILLWKKTFPDKIGMISLAVVLGGAMGNLIDRVFFGFVTDMFRTTFMNFAIFNIADICVVCGGIVFSLYYMFLYKEPPHELSPALVDSSITPPQETGSSFPDDNTPEIQDEDECNDDDSNPSD